MKFSKVLSLRHFSHRGAPSTSFWERFGCTAFVGSLYLVAFTPAAIVLNEERKTGYPRRGLFVGHPIVLFAWNSGQEVISIPRINLGKVLGAGVGGSERGGFKKRAGDCHQLRSDLCILRI